jgi:protein-tyrosine phosphatase
MTIQQLSVFLAVCEELNYTRAAARVYMSRQAVRQNITELERELSGALFESERNRLRLTAKGRLLRDKAAPLVEGFRELQAAMNADIHLSSPLHLGVSVALVPDYLPGLPHHLERFAASYPNLPISVLRLENDEATPALLAGALDACLVMDLGGQQAGTERTVLTRHPASVLMNQRNPLCRRESIGAEELDGRSLFLPGLGEEFRPLFEAAKRAGADVDFTVMPSFYQVLFHIMDHDGMALNRLEPADAVPHSGVRNVPMRGLPLLCSSFLVREGMLSSPLRLLRDWLEARLREDFPGN